MAKIYEIIGTIQHDHTKQFKKAIQNYEFAVERYFFTYCEDETLDNLSKLAHCHFGMANAFFDMGNYETADEHYRSALFNRKRVYNEESLQFANVYNNLGQNNYQQSDFKEAAQHTLRALEIYELIYDGFHENIPKMYHNLAKIYFETDEYVKAWKSYQQALKLYTLNYGIIFDLTDKWNFSSFIDV